MDVAKLVLEYAKVLAWPLVAAVALLAFGKPIRELIDRIEKLSWGDVSVALKAKVDQLAQTIATETAMPASKGVLDEAFLKGMFASARTTLKTSPEAAFHAVWECFELVVDKAEPALNVANLRTAVSAAGPWFRASPELVARGLPANLSASIAALVDLHDFAQIAMRSPRGPELVGSLIDAAETVTLALNATIPTLQPGEGLYDARTLTTITP